MIAVPPNQTVEFFGVDVRLSTLVETLIMRRDQGTVRVSRCVRWYQDQARQELYPTRKTTLNPLMHRAVRDRAIEMLIADSRSRAGETITPPKKLRAATVNVRSD